MYKITTEKQILNQNFRQRNKTRRNTNGILIIDRRSDTRMALLHAPGRFQHPEQMVHQNPIPRFAGIKQESTKIFGHFLRLHEARRRGIL